MVFHISQRTKIALFIIAVIVIGSGLFFARGVFTTRSVPPEFSDARLKGAEIAQTIVDLANRSREKLAKIETADQDGRYGEAVQFVGQALDENRKARDAAVKLSVELEHMTQVIPGIRPASARLLAIDAINSELTLVSHLITHNDYLFQLFEVLNEKFSGRRTGTDGKVKDLITNINAEIRAINELYGKFADSMVQFDALTQ